MNKHYVGPIIFITIITSTALLTISFSIAPRDISWLTEVENWIRRENWEPDREYYPGISAAFYLFENGEEQFFVLYSNEEFFSYIRGLVNAVNRRTSYISREILVDKILAKNKVLKLGLRLPLDFGTSNKYGGAYFILEDKTDMNLEGTIIIFDIKGRYGVWEITNWLL